MNATQRTKSKSRATRPAAAVVVVVLIVATAVVVFRAGGADAAAAAQPTFRVRQGPLTISVVESGTIKSLEQVSLKNEVEGNTTIIFLIPEGTRVQEGDLLVELDASNLQDNLIQQQISLDNAEAAFVKAREGLAVAKNQAESDISKAELDFQFAQEDVTQYVEGEHPQEVREAQSNITLNKEELERATEKLKWSEQLFEEKYISQTELDADRLAHNRAKLNHELAVASLELLEKYTSQRKLAELESNVEQMRMALERVKLQANADIVQAEADLKAKDTELRQQRSKFEKTQRQIAKTKILAPREGLVVYATSVQTGGRRWSREPLQEGQGVRERQELIYLPSAESMMAEIQIHESSLEKVNVGQPVRLKIDALPDVAFTGRVAKIAPLPDAQSTWLNPDLKVYATEIHLDGIHPELRTGMSCQAEIIVEQHAEATYVPVQSVVRLGAQPTVYVRSGGSFEPRSVEIGLDNNAMVHVLSGLTRDEEVSLTPPLDAKGEQEEPQVAVVPVSDTPGPAAGPKPQPGATPPTGERPAVQPGPQAGERPSEQPGAERGERPQLSDEERRERMRKRMESMTPEEREAFIERMRQRGGRGPGEGRGERPSGGRGPREGGQP